MNMNNIVDILTQPFVVYLLTISISIIVITIFVNIARSIAMLAIGLGLVYFVFIADSSKREELNKYSKSVTSVILKKTDNINGIEDVKNIAIEAINKSKDQITSLEKEK